MDFDFALQSLMTGLIVLTAFAICLFTVFRSVLAEPVARWMLKRGRVKSAMRFRALAAPGSSCGHGSCGKPACSTK